LAKFCVYSKTKVCGWINTRLLINEWNTVSSPKEACEQWGKNGLRVVYMRVRDRKYITNISIIMHIQLIQRPKLIIYSNDKFVNNIISGPYLDILQRLRPVSHYPYSQFHGVYILTMWNFN